MAVRNSEMITKGLKNIRNDFVLSNKKEDDAGLTRLIDEYNNIAKKNSNYSDITGEMTGKEIKEAINKLTFEEQMIVIYGYLCGSGKVSEILDYDQEVKKFRINFLWWAGYAFLFLFIAVIGGVITAGIIRNDINTNELLRIFMSLVNKITDIWFADKPVIE